MKKYFIGTGILCVTLDQIIKFLVKENLELGNSLPIINHFFQLTYVQNEGAAWSIFSGNILFLIIVALTALIIIGWYLYYQKKKGKAQNKEAIIYGVLYGGILGNLIDRVMLGHVIDYLDFQIINYQFPVFNLADICIVLSALVILIIEWRGEVHERNNNNN